MTLFFSKKYTSQFSTDKKKEKPVAEHTNGIISIDKC